MIQGWECDIAKVQNPGSYSIIYSRGLHVFRAHNGDTPFVVDRNNIAYK